MDNIKLRAINPNTPKTQWKLFFIETKKTVENKITVAPSFQNLMKVVE